MKLETLSRGITNYLKGLRQRERALQGFLNRNVLEMYRNLQRRRWMTENASEGNAWAALNPGYAARKKKVYAGYPGKGTKKLIATNTLFLSVIGPGKGFRKVTTPRSLIIATTVEYAPYVNEIRPFTEWSKRSQKEITGAVAKFIFKNELKNIPGIV